MYANDITINGVVYKYKQLRLNVKASANLARKACSILYRFRNVRLETNFCARKPDVLYLNANCCI